jgi:hypothetical protein
MARSTYRERERSRSPGPHRPAGIRSCAFHGYDAGHVSAHCDMLELERIMDRKLEDTFDELVKSWHGVPELQELTSLLVRQVEHGVFDAPGWRPGSDAAHSRAQSTIQ